VRNMSFALTTEQIRTGTKNVTRRMGWRTLKPGTLIRPVKKGMGLRPGEKIEPLRGPIRVSSVTFEPLRRMTDDVGYGIEECRREGFGEHPVYRAPSEFVQLFCSTHKGCTPESIGTRIEFEYLDAPGLGAAAGYCG
jgi:hypothetical protein